MKHFRKILSTHFTFLAWSKTRFALYLSTIVLAALLSAIIPFFYKQFVDLLPSGDYSALFATLVLYVAVRFSATILNTFSYFFGDLNIIPALVTVRSKVVKHIQDLDFAFHTTKSTGSLISAIKRGDGAFWSLTHGMHRILDVCVGFVVMAYVFSNLDVRFLVIVLVSFIVTLFAAKFLVKYNVDTRKRFNVEEDKVSSVIVDNIINFETVKIFAKEDWERKRLLHHFDPWKKRLWSHSYSWRVLDITLAIIISLSIFAILGLGLILNIEGALTIGEFVLLLGFVTTFYPDLWNLMMGFRDIAKNYEDITRYYGLLDTKIEIQDPENPVSVDSVKGEIEFKNVTFSYHKNAPDEKLTKRQLKRATNAIRKITLTIRQGQSIALVGRSGSGKTTLMKLLMRFYDVDSGSISVDKINIKDFTKSHLRSFMGVVPQEPILFNNTIAYNIGYGKPGAKQKEIEAAARLANLDKFINTLPRGYKTDVGERGIKLSGGQKQRLAISRMILSDPDIIIFDEATSQLDSENEKQIQDSFWKASTNKTTNEPPRTKSPWFL